MVCSLSALQDELESKAMERVLNVDAVRHCAGMLCYMLSWRIADILMCLKWMLQRLPPAFGISQLVFFLVWKHCTSPMCFFGMYDDCATNSSSGISRSLRPV